MAVMKNETLKTTQDTVLEKDRRKDLWEPGEVTRGRVHPTLPSASYVCCVRQRCLKTRHVNLLSHPATVVDAPKDSRCQLKALPLRSHYTNTGHCLPPDIWLKK